MNKFTEILLNNQFIFRIKKWSDDLKYPFLLQIVIQKKK